MYLLKKTKLIAILMLPVWFGSMTLHAQNSNDLKDLVQMPLAVDKAVKAGLPSSDIVTIARALRDGDVPPNDFNRTFHDVSYIAAERGPDGVHDIGVYTSGAVRDGLRGRELAQSIHTRLQSLGIPAGGRDDRRPSPIAEDYIPKHAKDRIQQHQNTSVKSKGRNDNNPAGQKNSERQRGKP